MARAYSPGLGQFLKAEQYYNAPSEFENALLGEGYKRAKYLAMMDQFYGELDETQRQFNETMGFKREELDWRKDVEEEAQEYRDRKLELGEERAESEEEWQRERLDKMLNFEWNKSMAELWNRPPARGGGGGGGRTMSDLVSSTLPMQGTSLESSYAPSGREQRRLPFGGPPRGPSGGGLAGGAGSEGGSSVSGEGIPGGIIRDEFGRILGIT